MIFHIAHRSDWERAVVAGAYRVSARGRTIDEEGFIHASTEEQLPATATRYYADDAEPLVVLTIDENRIAASGIELRWEAATGGELFPHIFGAIDPAWITEVHAAVIADGRFVIGG